MFKIMDLASVEAIPMDGGRGNKKKLVDTRLGTHAVDVHFNSLSSGRPRGKLHKHSVADNVYIVHSGKGELVVENEIHTIRKGQIIFIPAGMKHSLSNLSDELFEIFEIYAPAGDRFDFIACE
jgi:mannose-6-phosphate isomerase-like protein (cupin superfamily)